MATDDTPRDDVGRDPLAPDDLAAPPEPSLPPRPGVDRVPVHRPGEGDLREPVRLHETSVRRIDHRNDDPDAITSGLHDVTDPQSTMGATLAAERRRQGKSLADVEAATRIRGRLIESLEHGDYDALPDAAYVKGYIQSYADFLEIPSGPLVAQFTTETAGREAKAQQHPYITAPTSQATRRRRPRGPGSRPHDLHLPGGKLWIWILALAIVIASAIGIAGLLASRDQAIAPLPNPAVAPSKPATGVAEVTTGEATGTAATATTTPKALVLPPGTWIVTVRAKPSRKTTVKIVADGVILWNRPLSNMASKTVTLTADFCTVRVGVPSAAMMSLNGQQIPVPPNNDKPVIVRLDRPSTTSSSTVTTTP